MDNIITNSSNKILLLQWICSMNNDDIVERYSIIKYSSTKRIPEIFLEPKTSFITISRTSEELSIVGPYSMINKIDINIDPYISIESDYICFKVLGPLDFSLIGIINAISNRYVEFGISIFVISTYDTDYIFTKKNDINNFTTGKLLELIFEEYNHQNKYTFKFNKLLYSNGFQSRINTLIDFITRTNEKNIIDCKKSITLHIIGSDEQELPTLNEITLKIIYEKLILKYNSILGCNEIILVFIGPNMNKEFDKKSINFTLKKNNEDIIIQIFVYSTFYHDHFNELTKELDIPKPDIITLFNAGIWGYDSWKPTLNVFQFLGNVTILFTSYTVEEAEDDEDTIEKYYNDIGVDSKNWNWVWVAENNPNQSTTMLTRESIQSRKYYENFAWSVFHFK